MKIAIEGMDGVGKTTIAKRLAKDLNYLYIDKPLQYFFYNDKLGELEFKNFLKNLYSIDDPLVKAWVIGLGNIYSCRNFKNQNLILDRHLVSNYFWNGTKESKIIFKTIIDIIGKPDMTILLFANPETRVKRMKLRNPNDNDIMDPEKMVLGYDKMKVFLDEFKISYIPINTENENENKVYEKVYKLVTEKIKNNNVACKDFEFCR